MNKINGYYQNIIIGFGKGGKTLAAWLSANGQEVAVIEQSSAMYGGSCINIACIPTKSLITNAARGIPYFDAHAIKDQLTSLLRQKNYDKVASGEKAVVIDGIARFIGPGRIEVTTTSGVHEMSADRIFINTGTRPATAAIPGIFGRHIYNSTTLMEQTERPGHLVVVGGGYVGLEFASMFLQFGARVTLMDHNETFLPLEDRDIADSILKDLKSRGLEFINGVRVTEFKDASEDTVAVFYTKGNQAIKMETDAVLMATGRTPATDTLNLSAAGIQTDAKGFVKVNEQLQTTADNTWAIGDVNGGPQFTYISLDDFRIIKNQLSGGKYISRSQRKAYATSLFIQPTYSRIGLNETQAKEQGLDYRVFTLPASSIPKAAILREQQGLLKAIVDRKTDRILGCMLYCAEAHELISIIQLAMHADICYQQLRDNVYAHPTMAEAFNDLFAG